MASSPQQSKTNSDDNPVAASGQVKTNMITKQHTYHDFSHVPPPGAAAAEETEGGEPRLGRTFPLRLHHMLSQLEMDHLSHIVSWQPHGRCFLVHKQQDFVDLILPL